MLFLEEIKKEGKEFFRKKKNYGGEKFFRLKKGAKTFFQTNFSQNPALVPGKFRPVRYVSTGAGDLNFLNNKNNKKLYQVV